MEKVKDLQAKSTIPRVTEDSEIVIDIEAALLERDKISKQGLAIPNIAFEVRLATGKVLRGESDAKTGIFRAKKIKLDNTRITQAITVSAENISRTIQVSIAEALREIKERKTQEEKACVARAEAEGKAKAKREIRAVEEAEKQRKIKAEIQQAAIDLKERNGYVAQKAIECLNQNGTHPLAREVAIAAATSQDISWQHMLDRNCIPIYCDQPWAEEVILNLAYGHPREALLRLPTYYRQKWAKNIVVEIVKAHPSLAFEKIEIYEYQPWAEEVAEIAVALVPHEALKHFDKYKRQPWATNIVGMARSIIDLEETARQEAVIRQEFARQEAARQEEVARWEAARQEAAREETARMEKEKGIAELALKIVTEDQWLFVHDADGKKYEAGDYGAAFRMLADNPENQYAAQTALELAKRNPQKTIECFEIYKACSWAREVVLAIVGGDPETAKRPLSEVVKSVAIDIRDRNELLTKFLGACNIDNFYSSRRIKRALRVLVECQNHRLSTTTTVILDSQESIIISTGVIGAPLCKTGPYTPEELCEVFCKVSQHSTSSNLPPTACVEEIALGCILKGAPTTVVKAVDVYKNAPWARAVLMIAAEQVPEAVRDIYYEYQDQSYAKEVKRRAEEVIARKKLKGGLEEAKSIIARRDKNFSRAFSTLSDNRENKSVAELRAAYVGPISTDKDAKADRSLTAIRIVEMPRFSLGGPQFDGVELKSIYPPNPLTGTELHAVIFGRKEIESLTEALLCSALWGNTHRTVSCIGSYKGAPWAEGVMEVAAKSRVSSLKVLRSFSKYRDRPWAKRVKAIAQQSTRDTLMEKAREIPMRVLENFHRYSSELYADEIVETAIDELQKTDPRFRWTKPSGFMILAKRLWNAM